MDAPLNASSAIARVLSGDQAAFAEIVRAHQAPILRLCSGLLHDSALAEDAAQEVFFKAYRKLSAYRGESAFGTWLYRIAANHCLDLLRKRKRERVESLDALIEESGDAIQERLPAAKNPASAVADAEFARQALERLSPDYRLILTLREMQGLSYQELAAALDCSLDAVKARLRRARQALLERSGDTFAAKTPSKSQER